MINFQKFSRQQNKANEWIYKVFTCDLVLQISYPQSESQIVDCEYPWIW